MWVSYWCGMRTISTVLGAGSAVDTKIRVLESFLTLNLSLITNSIRAPPNVNGIGNGGPHRTLYPDALSEHVMFV